MGERNLESIVSDTMVNKNDFKYAVLVTDRHTGIESDVCDKILKKYIKDNKSKITHYIDLGDGIDNPHMSHFPVDPKFIMTAQEEFDLYAAHLKDIHNLIPRAKKIIIAGNHDKSRLSNAKNLNRGLASLRNIQYENVLKEAMTNVGIPLKLWDIGKNTATVKFTRSYTDLFTHGDPRMDPNIKGGVTGIRRTAETYPHEGNVYMGHGHWFQRMPRKYPNKFVTMLGGMMDIKKMEKMYIGHHPYQNGFGVIKYNKKEDLYVFEYYPIVKGVTVIDGKIYN